MANKIKKAQDGLSLLNPKNWGVDDYSKEKTFSSAYKKARMAEKNEFLYKGKRYNTDYKGSEEEQFESYGVTNEYIKSNLDETTKKNLWDAAYHYSIAEYSNFKDKPGASLNNILKLSEAVGNPKIKVDKDLKRSRYNALSNKMTLNDSRSYADEAAHAAQSNMALRSITDWFKNPYISSTGYDRQYHIPGTVEYEAHTEIEPMIMDILNGGLSLEDANLEQYDKGGKIMKNKKLTKYKKYGQDGLSIIDPNSYTSSSLTKNRMVEGLDIIEDKPLSFPTKKEHDTHFKQKKVKEMKNTHPELYERYTQLTAQGNVIDADAMIMAAGGIPIFQPLSTVKKPTARSRILDIDFNPEKTQGYRYKKGVPDKESITPYQKGGVIKDNRGQWAHPGKVTQIDSNNITMKGVKSPVLEISDIGDTKMMYPDNDYTFNGNNVTEFPMGQNGMFVKQDNTYVSPKARNLGKPREMTFGEESFIESLPGTISKRERMAGVEPFHDKLTQKKLLNYYDKSEFEKSHGKISDIMLPSDFSSIDEYKSWYNKKYGNSQFKSGGKLKSYRNGGPFSMNDIPQQGATQIQLPTYQPQGTFDTFYGAQNQNNTVVQPQQGNNFYNKIGGAQGIAKGVGAIRSASQMNSAEGPSGAQQAVGQFGPWGAAISMASQAVTGITDKSENEGVYTAGKVIFDPASAWTNKDLSKRDRIWGGLNPLYGAKKAFQAKKEREAKEAELRRIVQEAGASQDNIKRRYIRPEDQISNPNELSPSYGTGTSYLKKGGSVPYMEHGGDLQTYWGGKAEVASENPYLPYSGETIEFKGDSHAEGGIGVKFGGSKIEVEGGEPAVKLRDGKDYSLVVFGDMKIPSYGVSELMDPKAKGKKFKNYINDLNKIENKQNKIVEKGVEIVNDTPVVDSFDKLKVSSGKAMIEGGNMKLKEIAAKKQIAANVQNAILETAEEFGLKSDELAKGKFKKAKMGKKVKYQDGGPFAHHTNYNPSIIDDGFADSVAPTRNSENVDWMAIANTILPYIRPSNRRSLDPNQLSGERYALATNQLEAVQAQTYDPLLENVSDISLQDQLNANQADFNSLQRYTDQNPAAQAALAAQKYQANSSVLGEQFRLNQAQKQGVYNRNRGVLNDASFKNLSILDQQYVRQSQAKSNTKAVAQAAISSISDKIARNKLENRTLGIYENMYNYRYDNSGRAINWNGFAQFNVDSGAIQVDENGKVVMDESKIKRDKNGMIINSTETRRSTDKKKSGGIVKAINSL